MPRRMHLSTFTHAPSITTPRVMHTPVGPQFEWLQRHKLLGGAGANASIWIETGEAPANRMKPSPGPCLNFFTSDQVLRDAHLFPRDGANNPWHSRPGFALDLFCYRFSRIDHNALRFSKKLAA